MVEDNVNYENEMKIEKKRGGKKNLYKIGK